MRQIVDHNVAADGQGGQNVYGPYNGAHETYVWKLNDYTLATDTDRNGYTTKYSATRRAASLSPTRFCTTGMVPG
jgi:hypothetical protein